MKNSTTSVLGFDVPVSGVVETLPELVEAAGGEQPVVDLMVGYSNAHKTNTEARGAVVEALEKVTGIKRATENVKSPTKADPNRTVEKFSESEQTYADRVRAETQQTTEQLWTAIASEVGTIPFKVIGEARTGSTRVGKEDAKKAETLLAAGDDMWKQAVQLLTQKNPGLEIALGEDGKPTVETLASAIKVNRVRIQKEEDASLGLAA
jgi:hypothetical protein